ncbi:MAG: nicotinate-nicotinamide nucleotide adenylyltransferase [Candidatus Jidaibacter sp.]|jgi:nicotinate-nucleotide adenylyltransferase|nr:nicotinate-nicotinamide nucleotide adenylyltransferase [Candidatus Jidaibacter sp.]
MAIRSNKYQLLPISSSSRMKIGILGGTFNPAHEGHRYISIEAIKRFGLDLVIWFVTPQNPLKSKGLADTLDARLIGAKAIAKHPKILVTDYEAHLNNNYTISLLKRLKLMYKNVDFCYIIGADNMRQLPRWYKWKEILHNMPVIIFDREEHHKHLISSKMKACFGGGRIGPIHKAALSQRKWYFVKLRKNSKSSTQIRNEQND